MSLLFNMLSRFVIAFLPKNKHLLISLLSEMILAPKKINCHCFHFSPIYFPWVMGLDIMILAFWMLSFKPVFQLSTFTLIKRLFTRSVEPSICQQNERIPTHYIATQATLAFMTSRSSTAQGYKRYFYFSESGTAPELQGPWPSRQRRESGGGTTRSGRRTLNRRPLPSPPQPGAPG